MPASDTATLAPEHIRARPLLEALAVFLLVLLSVYFTVIAIYQSALDAQKQEIRQSLLRTANLVMSQIDPQLHLSFNSPELESSPDYIAQEDRLMRIRFSDPSIAYIYSVVRIDDKVRFVLDPTPPPAEGEEDTRVNLLQHYDDAPEDLIRAFETDQVVTSQEPYSDQWGSFVSAFVPLHDNTGKQIAIVCVDIDATEYFARLAPIKRATARAMVTAFFVAFLAASGTWFLRNFLLVLARRKNALYENLQKLDPSGSA